MTKKTCLQKTFVAALLFGVVLTPYSANAQTPQQMEYERQQREYRQQQEQQRQEQQRQQQLMNDNARRQQEETNRSIRANTPSSSIPSAPSGGAAPTTSGAGSSSSGPRAPQETRQMWEKQPPLAPDRNPLIGRWARQTADQSTLAGAIMSMVSAGACGLFFGTDEGFVEFRPTTLVAVERSGREQVLAEVTYRGRAKRVAVLPRVSPQALIDLFVFDVDSADRITLSNYDCKMVRAGGAHASANQAPSAASVSGTSAPQTPGALAVTAGFAAPGGAFQPLVGGAFFVLKESANAVLAKGGVGASPNASPLKTWATACGADQLVCRQGMLEIVKSSVGVIKTNSAGQAQLVGLPSGTYYLFGLNVLNAQPVLWNVKTDLKPGAGSVTLDQRNAMELR